VQQEGSAEHIITEMFNEVLSHYLKPNGIVFCPHEMPGDHWNAISKVASAAYDVFPCFTSDQQQELFDNAYPDFTPGKVNTVGYINNRFWKECGWGYSGPAYSNNGDTNRRHDVHVAYALANGKPVPEHVIAEYRDLHLKNMNPSWLPAVLNFPQLRGVLSVDKLQSLWCVLHGQKIQIDAENVDYLLTLMQTFPMENPDTVAMDDYLYRAGFLPEHPPMAPAPETFDPLTAVSPLALKIRDYIGKGRQESTIARAHKERVDGRYSLRELERQLAYANSLAERESIKWGNTVAKAIIDKDVTFLLHILDCPDAQNTSSKKAIQEECLVKLLGLKSKDRRDAIFTLSGYDSEQRAKYEAEVEIKENLAKVEQVKNDILDQMKNFKIKTPLYGTLDVKDYVDQAVKDGYSGLYQTKEGRKNQFWLINPTTRSAVSIKQKDGTLAYARDVLKLVDHTQAQAA
jgi:hypothetical protein